MAAALLPDITRDLYPFTSHYIALSDGKRMHYIDEGTEDGEVLVFIHGYPTWSFLYRAFIVYYAAQGYRCIAMDHIGYGLSDKPTNKRYHTLRRHIHNVLEGISTLNLHNVTLIMEDWGGPMGLGYAIRRRDNIKRLVIMNSWAFQGSYFHRLHPLLRLATRPWIGELLLGTLNLVINYGLQRATLRSLPPSVMAGYRAPFHDVRNRTALYQFPRMISNTPSHPSTPMLREIENGLAKLQMIPALLVWGEEDSVFSPDVADRWKELMPRAKGPHLLKARHFLPEDDPEGVIQHLDQFLASS
jgi:haloalkane dehalogenase